MARGKKRCNPSATPESEDNNTHDHRADIRHRTLEIQVSFISAWRLASPLSADMSLKNDDRVAKSWEGHPTERVDGGGSSLDVRSWGLHRDSYGAPSPARMSSASSLG